MPTVYVGAGSNVAPEPNMARAVEELRSAFPGARFSTWYRNRAAGFAGEDFINLVTGFDTALPPHAVQRQVGVEGRHEIYEVLAFEANRTIAIPGREARPGKFARQLRHRARQVALGGDVAAGADVDGGHGLSFRRPAVCALQEGDRREYARSRHRHRASYEWRRAC